MTWLASLTEPLWVKFLVVFLIGMTAGAWIDAFLRRRESAARTRQPVELTPERRAVMRDLAVQLSELGAIAIQYKPNPSDDVVSIYGEHIDRVWVLLQRISYDQEISNLARYCAKMAMLVIGSKHRNDGNASARLVTTVEAGEKLFERLSR